MNRLLKVNGHLYFRMRTPRDLLHIFRVQEIKKSMHTKTLKDAKILAVTYSYKLEKLFLKVRCGMLSEKEIQALVKEFFDKTLNTYEQDRAEGRWIPDPEDLEDHESEYISMHHEGCKVAVAEGRKALAMNDLTFIEPEVNELLEENKVSVDRQSLQFKMLCREILKAFIQVHEVEQDRVLGRYDTLNTHAAVTSSTIENKKVGVLLSKAIDQFLDEKVSKKEFTSATVDDCRSVYKVLLQVVGDVDLSEINKESAIKFRDVVSRIPKNMNVIKEFKGKAIDEVLRIVEKKNNKKEGSVTLLSDTSRSKYVERVSMLMKWCIESAFYIDRNYFKKLAVKYDEEEKNRRSFTTDELQKLRHSPIYQIKKIPIIEAHEFFIPLIALFTGMRENEMCQLHAKDIRLIDGVWCIDVNKDTSDKRLKNKSARRIVPIHPTLIQAGFIQYVEMMLGLGHDRLWIGLQFKKKNYKEAYSQAANKYIDKHVTDDKKVAFHAFRNTFINNLKQQDISEPLVAAIAGQKHPNITFSTYGEKYDPKPLLDVVMKLEYGVDFSEVKFPIEAR